MRQARVAGPYTRHTDTAPSLLINRCNSGNSEGGWGVCERAKYAAAVLGLRHGLNVECCGRNRLGGCEWRNVINLSLGSYYGDAITLAAVNNAVANVVVAAAGNSEPDSTSTPHIQRRTTAS